MSLCVQLPLNFSLMNSEFSHETKLNTYMQSVRPKRNKRLRVVALILFCLGSVLTFFRSTAVAYAQGLVAPDGVYIPESQHTFPKFKKR